MSYMSEQDLNTEIFQTLLSIAQIFKRFLDYSLRIYKHACEEMVTDHFTHSTQHPTNRK